MSRPKTIGVRLPGQVVAEAKLHGVLNGKTPGEMLAQAFCDYLAEHDAELDRLEDEARAKRKALAKRGKPKPDGGRTYA